ncbi:MAG: DoxX family membrane protein [Myxococcales bacterium]
MDTSAGVRIEDRAIVTIYRTLKLVFGLVPIVAGLDKFTNILVHWERYLAPAIANMIPMKPTSFMHIVGIIEIVAGIGVLVTPWTRVFAWIVGLWLIGIALDLVLAGYYDIAVRDVVMAISSFCLARVCAAMPARAEATQPLGHAQARSTGS